MQQQCGGANDKLRGGKPMAVTWLPMQHTFIAIGPWCISGEKIENTLVQALLLFQLACHEPTFHSFKSPALATYPLCFALVDIHKMFGKGD